MQVTSNERRKAAENLRNAATDDLEGANFQKFTAVLCNAEDGSWSGVMRRLADLIDPTCEDMATHREDAFAPGKKACDGYFSCYRCNFNGRVFESIGFGDMATMEVRYCPNCGARVVSGHE